MGNYLTKSDVADAILKDYTNYPPCCLYMQEIRFEKDPKTNMSPRFFPPEQINAIKKLEMSQTHCNFKNSCRSKYQIKVHFLAGLVYYECNRKMFRSLYNAKNYARERQNRHIYFGGKKSVIFNKNDPPYYVNETNRKVRGRSKSI